jgi:gluconokinase
MGCALHGILAVDRHGSPISGVITWADDRAAEQARQARASAAFQRLYDQTGCPIHWMYPLYKILWLKQTQPTLFAQAIRFITLKEYVLQKLTGQYLVDYGMAAGSGLLNTHDLKWSGEICALIGIRPEQLSPLAEPRTALPASRSDLVDAMGILPGVPIYLGSSDAANSSMGAGAVHSWQATCMVGTSGALRVIANRPILDTMGRSWCYAIDRNHWLVGGAINNGGLAVAWLRDLFTSAWRERQTHPELSFEELTALAGCIGPGADGLVCLPFFAGERSPNWNLDASGAFVGLTLNHDSRHIARSILEGIAFRLRSLDDVLKELSLDCTQIRASGGFTHSPLWLQITASVLERELSLPATGETSSLGAALWAMLGAGAVASLEDVYPLIPMAESYQPSAEHIRVYRRVYPVYRELYQAVSPYFGALADLSSAG